MDIQTAAMIFEKLGHPVRLEIVKLLVRAGPEGLAVGALQKRLDIPNSTLSHHISHLVAGGVISQTRESRRLMCRPNFERLDAVVAVLTESCCAGVAPDGTDLERDIEGAAA